MSSNDGILRCGWAGEDPLYVRYHDEEWGVPVHDDRHLFEMLILEGAQAGLSWITILKKRENYRAAFDGFDAERVARYDDAKIAALLQDPGIVRNRLKVESAVKNARAFLDVREEFGSFDAFLWPFIGEAPRHNAPWHNAPWHNAPRQNAWRSLGDVPAETAESKALSKELRRRGFKFVGPTICYAFMQAVGMVNDHVVACFRHPELQPPSGARRSSP